MAAPTASIDADFRRIVDAFKAKAELTPDELQSFQFSKLDDVTAVLASIQKKQSQTKRLAYMRRIDPFMKTMLEFGKVVDVFLNASEILAFVWGPLKLLLMVTSSFTDAFDSLLDTYQQIAEQIPLLESYKNLFSDHAHMRSLLLMIYEDILGFHVLALKYFRQKLWRQLFKSNWKGFASQITTLKENLRRHKQLIEGHASLTEFEYVRSLRLAAEENSREHKAAESRRRRTAVFQWLSSPAVEAAHEKHVKARSSNPQSCQWILQDDSFQKWFDPLYCSTPLLWINGKPGAGKSVLASLVIEEAKKLSDISVAFFYFAQGDPERDKFVPMARAMLSQLLAENESLLLHVETAMATSGGQAELSSSALAQELLKTALQSRKTFVILDGIDECGRDARKEICTWFRSVVDSLPRIKQDEVRCLFISQDDGFARKDLAMLPTLSITSDHNRADIQAFARTSQERIEAALGTCPLGKSGLEISQVVTARSQGMFIYAKCVLDELEQYPTKQALQHDWPAEGFPGEMEEVYDRIYRRLTEKTIKPRRDMTHKLLSWISQSKRPLRWYEIRAAISIDLENETINEEGRLLGGDSKDLCASFVEVLPDQTVELVHSTARDFLTSRAIIKSSQVDLDLCMLSVAYLNFPDFSASTTPAEIRDALLQGRHSFYDYAVACWVPHLMSWLSAEEPSESNISNLAETLEAFLDQHYSEAGPEITISNSMHKKLKVFQQFDFYDSLVQAVVWSRKQLLIGQNNDQNANRLDFPNITAQIRSAIESLDSSQLTQEMVATLEKFYGGKWFKCPNIYCQHFYNGFKTQETRDRHVSRHERAYTCTFDGCPTATFGCISKKDLEAHMLESHGITSDADDFPDVPNPDPDSSSTRVQKNPAAFQCTLCPRGFTRAYNLRSHLRSHSDERPFVCTVCGKSFSRQHDRKRHEALHTGEKKFVCKGNLRTGDQWGCGTRFSRDDQLGAHFRTEFGKLCVQPLLDQERWGRPYAMVIQRSQRGAEAGNDNWTRPAASSGSLDMTEIVTEDPQKNFQIRPRPATPVIQVRSLPDATQKQYPALQNMSSSGSEDD